MKFHIYLDENLSQYVAEGLNSFNKADFSEIVVSSTKIDFGVAVLDKDLIPVLGAKKGIFITRDINIYRTKAENGLLKEFQLGVFFLDLPKGQCRHWDIVRLLINNWEEIIGIIKKKSPPFTYIVKPKSGVKPL